MNIYAFYTIGSAVFVVVLLIILNHIAWKDVPKERKHNWWK